MNDLIFQSSPDVVIVSNTFRNVPIILQFEDTPLLEVGRFAEAGYTTRFTIFHEDGTKIAVVDGSRIHLTPEGKNAKIERRFERDLTVCELEGKPLFELRRRGAAALHGWAELYAPEGVLIKAADEGVSGLLRSSDRTLQIGGIQMSGSTITGYRIGMHVTKQGISIGHN